MFPRYSAARGMSTLYKQQRYTGVCNRTAFYRSNEWRDGFVVRIPFCYVAVKFFIFAVVIFNSLVDIDSHRDRFCYEWITYNSAHHIVVDIWSELEIQLQITNNRNVDKWWSPKTCLNKEWDMTSLVVTVVHNRMYDKISKIFQNFLKINKKKSHRIEINQIP